MSTAPATSSDIRAIEARLGEKGKRVFTQAGWNKALRDAGIAAGNFWIGNYGVLRWNAGYARSRLGYVPKRAKAKRMARGEAPFYSSGQFMAGFNSRSRTVATAKKGRTSFAVRVPGGFLNFHPEHVAAFRKIPPGEAAAVAREFRRALIQSVQTGRAQAHAKQQARAAARLAKKQATAARRAAARANRSTRRARAVRSEA